MSTILFHSSSLVYELGLHNARRSGADAADNRPEKDIGVRQTLPAPSDGTRVTLRRVHDRRRRVDLQQSA